MIDKGLCFSEIEIGQLCYDKHGQLLKKIDNVYAQVIRDKNRRALKSKIVVYIGVFVRCFV